MKERCFLIPAIKKNAVIPDQLVKKLAGETLIQRSLNTARACARQKDIFVLTDSEEISLICERNGVGFFRNQMMRFHTWNIVPEMRETLARLAREYRRCVILRPSCPLITWVDVEKAYKRFSDSKAGSLISVRKTKQRLWRASVDGPEELLAEAGSEAGEEFVLETRALIILDLAFLAGGQTGKTIPWFLGERGLEILDYQDWWICERLLARRHMVFTVAGYPAIGMGHVYRALMLAHEISAHKITFVCTAESGLAVESVASRDYPVIRQGNEPLSETVLARQPDLVVNDFLNTSLEYMRPLREGGISCVNFEDEGEGAAIANLVINALDDKSQSSPHRRCGPDYFCLRDEFIQASRNPFRTEVRTVLITFGGTDQRDSTLRILDLIAPLCAARKIAIRIVAGPGYAHKENLEKRIGELASQQIEFTWATNVMSRMMEGVDLAICSAGRTVYELAHMRCPGIVLATHEREAEHTFARPRHGFAFAGLMAEVSDERLLKLFMRLLEKGLRQRYWIRQDRVSFAGNKQRVIGLITDQLEGEK